MLPILLDEEDEKNCGHPNQVHQADDAEHDHHRPAAAHAKCAVNDTGTQRVNDAATIIVHRDEHERALAFVETELLPARELVSARYDENRSGERRQPPRLRSIVAPLRETPIREQRHDADRRPNE